MLDHLADVLRDVVVWLTHRDGAGVTRWLLFAVFVLAGTWKIRHPALAGLALYNFGVLRRPISSAGIALGVGEIMLATALALPNTVGQGLVATAVVLWVFSYASARQLAMGASFSCFCLADADDQLSRATVLRAAALAVLATLAGAGVAEPSSVAFSRTSAQLAVGVALIGIYILVLRFPGAVSRHEHPPLVLESTGGTR